MMKSDRHDQPRRGTIRPSRTERIALYEGCTARPEDDPEYEDRVEAHAARIEAELLRLYGNIHGHRRIS